MISMSLKLDKMVEVRYGSGKSFVLIHLSRQIELPYGPGDKEQLMCQDATAKFDGSDILRKVQKTISFCTKLT